MLSGEEILKSELLVATTGASVCDEGCPLGLLVPPVVNNGALEKATLAT
ncbi:hypothetical protein OH492_20560 [Vibrio chagasii]|nr:hypothetical protein [Vibrio chagasii]